MLSWCLTTDSLQYALMCHAAYVTSINIITSAGDTV